VLEPRLVPADISAPVILQWFDGSHQTIEKRATDVFAAGYGVIYTPPPGRADSGDGSVGYDVYDRFDLGSPGHPTLYGTETGLKSAVDAIHRLGGTWTVDFVDNHNGFSDLGTPGFKDAGAYPGFLLTSGFDIDGDFHGAFEGGDLNGRLAGLIDIAQEKNYQFIRSPVSAGDPNNLPAGTTPAFGRLANVPDANNRRLYPDRQLAPIFVFDPTTGESNIPIYPFNTADPIAGDAVQENALGLLMRNAQWLVQAIGVDGLRLDAAKHYPTWVLNYIDRAVYRQNPRLLLDGSTNNVFSFSEVFDGNKSFLQSFIRKDINPNDPGRVGGNRDVLDFPLFFALHDNLSGNGLANDWYNIVNASLDSQDDGLANNGSQGVAFVSSHDSDGPYLSNVAYAYTLLRPGNAIVYFNGHEFGNRDFPKDGRGDALGGLYGNAITRLVDIRNTHGRGNYIERWLEKELLAYERQGSALVLLNNRMDAGFDSRTIQTSFAPGTKLIELTGNASDPTADPFDDIPELLTVNEDSTVNVRFLRNRAPGTGTETGRGYLIYGLAGPQGTLSLTNVNQTLAGETPTTGTNGIARVTPIDVITGDSFQVKFDTNAVTLLGSIRDPDADGDNALLRLDGGLDANGNGRVDFSSPGGVTYGFENFLTTHDPGFGSADGNGHYTQTIDATGLAEGMHFITARAFRHRADGGPAVFTDFRLSIYVDRLPAVSAIDSFSPIAVGVNENRLAVVRSIDKTADNVHVFLDLPAALTDAQVLSMVGGASQGDRVDRDLWTKDFSGLTSGNHVLTTVSYEITGRASVQRFPGQFTSTIFGAGFGDLDFDGDYDPADVTLFRNVLESADTQFNPAADLNGDGRINNSDLIRLHDRLLAVGASPATLAAYEAILGPKTGGYAIAEGDDLALAVNQPTVTSPTLTFAWDLNHDGRFNEAAGPGPVPSWAALQALGIKDSRNYPIKLRVADGAESTDFSANLNISNTPPTASLTNAGPQFERVPVAISFMNQSDPSAADTAAGFRYSFDFNYDGDFTDRGEITDSRVPTRSFAFPHEGTFTVRGRIKDKDGGASFAFTQVTVKNTDLIVTGTGPGGPAAVKAFDSVSGSVRFTLLPFDSIYRGGVTVASGDVTGDHIPDIVVGTAGGWRTTVKVFDGVSGAEVVGKRFEAFANRGVNGVSVAIGDVNGDGVSDIIAGAGPFGPSLVRVVSGTTGSALALFATSSGTSGMRVAAGDVNGDGRADIITSPMAGPGAVRIYDAKNFGLLQMIGAFNGYTGGLFVAAGDLDGDVFAEILVSQDHTTNPRVRIYHGTGALYGELTPLAGSNAQGATIAAVDRDGDDKADLIVGPGRGTSRVHTFRGTDLALISELTPFGPGFVDGIFVG